MLQLLLLKMPMGLGSFRYQVNRGNKGAANRIEGGGRFTRSSAATEPALRHPTPIAPAFIDIFSEE